MQSTRENFKEKEEKSCNPELDFCSSLDPTFEHNTANIDTTMETGDTGEYN